MVAVIYPLTGYEIGGKPAPAGGPSRGVLPTAADVRAAFDREGLQRTVLGVLIVERHAQPHVLVLRAKAAGASGGAAAGDAPEVELPGGRVGPAEDEGTALVRCLNALLSVPGGGAGDDVGSGGDGGGGPAWKIGETLAVWWRPHAESATVYPYVPPQHRLNPVESIRVVMVTMPPAGCFAVPDDRELVAVPLIDLHNDAERFGPVLAALPAVLSRVNFVVNSA